VKSNYPRKCWYAAAMSDELADSPIGRKVLGQDVVLWRSDDGHVIALDNHCAHRGFPLSDGRIADGQLVCGYHGCTYGADGRCVCVPTQPEVPTRMQVRSFPATEQPPFVWVWLGPPAAAENARPPKTAWLSHPGWTHFAQSWQVQANYMMVHEHYLDFSYAPVVHGDDLPPGLDRLPLHDEVEVRETSVAYQRTLPLAPLADWEAEATGLDRTQAYARTETGTFAAPSLHIQRWSIQADVSEYTTIRCHAITPETETSTRVFMWVSRNYALDSATTDAALNSFVDGLVQRDCAVIERAAADNGYARWNAGIEFRADAAVLRARRIVAVMLAKEAGRSALRPGVSAGPVNGDHRATESS
jgi:phenylpropionate dioxygenase-like ring-hydroxylating dioxygenase large terminal subunit